MTYKAIKNKLGYYEIIPRPETDFLEDYYENKYCQNGIGDSLNYSAEEANNIRNKQNELYQLLASHIETDNKSMCDVGCGEGWNLKFFKEKGWKVTGIDISNFGILEKNPSLDKDFIKTGIMDGLYDLEMRGKLFDIILLMNVLEHVLEPVKLIEKLKKLLSKDGLLVIQIPNDYSLLQIEALNRGFVSESYWVTPPDHLNYFDTDSLVKLLDVSAFFCKDLFSNFPIEFNLFNDATNYQKSKMVGKSVHQSRIVIENIISTAPFDSVMNLYRALAEVGLGRNVTGIFQKHTTSTRF
jgi:2-polyprenyl-3-methyl-5-hydroxy-6-metoxy-1,4-benzoquinol methylase